MIDRMRLVYDKAHSASFNMAADETLLMMALERKSPPTLRFYRWEKPTVSIGFFQNTRKEINLDKIIEKGMDFVRRPTGGRAVLHWKEVTFCLTIPTVGKGLWEIFRRVHEAIGSGLREAGINAGVEPADRHKIFSDESATDRSAACFASPSRYELLLNGKKVAGTAQKQVKDHILIHGSIPIISTYDSLYEVLVFSDEDSREKAYEKALQKMTSIYSETGIEYSYDELTKHIASGFISEWNCRLEESSLNAEELCMIDEQETEKYKNPAWLFRK
jgi:lipoyl(octanoyl) transferase